MTKEIYDMSPEDIQQKIEQYLPIKVKEKNKNGEVFTPIELIEEMLDKLPKEVWLNPELKWLDPSNGIGNFPMIAYTHLMEGLEDWEPDRQKRSNHIIQNMLYMVELNQVNVDVSRKIFGKDANIVCGSFLEQEFPKQFDIIMGNPPYNKNGVGKGGGVFWRVFVNKSLELLNTNGYLTFVHPLGWRKPFKEGDRNNNAGKIFYDFKRIGHLQYIHISDEKIPNFPKVDYYVFQKKNKPNPITHVVNKYKSTEQHSHINVSNLEFIPNLITDTCSSVLNKLMVDKGQKLNIVRDQSFKVSKDDLIKAKGVPHAWTPLQNEYKIVYKEYNTIPEYITRNKVILTHVAGSSKLHNNLFAKYYSTPIGTTSMSMYQLVDNKKQGIQLENYFNSKLITFLIKITQYTDGQYAANEFKILNMISMPVDLKDNPTDQDIYDYYGITKEEKELIETTFSFKII